MKRKDSDIKEYQVEMLEIVRPIFIHHILKLMSLVANQGFPKPSIQNLNFLIFKTKDQNNRIFNNSTIITIHILTKNYIIIMKSMINTWLGSDINT